MERLTKSSSSKLKVRTDRTLWRKGNAADHCRAFQKGKMKKYCWMAKEYRKGWKLGFCWGEEKTRWLKNLYLENPEQVKKVLAAGIVFVEMAKGKDEI